MLGFTQTRTAESEIRVAPCYVHLFSSGKWRILI